MILGLGILVVMLIVLVIVLIFLLCKERREKVAKSISLSRWESRATNFEIAEEDGITAESLYIEFKTLEMATNNFSDENKLGEGGFGLVYKGTLPNGKEIAVKRLSKNSDQGPEQFKNEVMFVAKLQHRNLVRLLGYCDASNEMLLVYEFVPNNSLDKILFDPEARESLDWPARHKIIHGIARGLQYLHEDSRLKIVHRDLKAGNILLDADLSPKITDFGLARKFSVNQELDLASKLVGTFGYMAPEYIKYSQISTKSDVYSFGIVVLEILSGKKISHRQTALAENLLAYAWRQWNAGTPLQFVDNSLANTYPPTEVRRCLHISLLCVQGEVDDRPPMSSVVSYLRNKDLELPMPQNPEFLTINGRGSNLGYGELFPNNTS